MLTTYFDEYARDYEYYKGGAWCYEDGCLYRGLISLHQSSGDDRWFDHLQRLVDGQIRPDGRLVGYQIEEFNIDNILPGRALLYLHEQTGEQSYLDAAMPLARQLRHHPLTKSQVYWHKLRYPHQIWLDGLYMALPFKVELSKSLNDKAMEEEAINQFKTALELTCDTQSGLYRHGYDESRIQLWADPDTGKSSAHWGRAIGWLSMAFVDIIENLDEGEHKDELLSRFEELASRLTELHTKDDRWLQVLDKPDLPGNYPESSATAMFSYALQKGARLGLSASFARAGRDALVSLISKELHRDESGRLKLHHICCVAGLGPFKGLYRDGSDEYYLTEAINPDDIKGVGPLMMAHAERQRAEKDQQASQPASEIVASASSI
ncbi:glycoside hydrolase family 88 protein [Peteryoungia desertarenae]|uniref:Glycoside hydrolase family 88 protein n=1 Tax=Peteryoungia desertarenae TaxID=1813451 RepID=A0ABX6QJF8_9HYPH|nr:glycoside hydrolase family 88 protein [Peteryoungia desertarenae]QLF68422.1 glycoside hydrolase family 88 protein [Peteryoungia desertarenae]